MCISHSSQNICCIAEQPRDGRTRGRRGIVGALPGYTCWANPYKNCVTLNTFAIY